jgi:hypothetical protein
MFDGARYYACRGRADRNAYLTKAFNSIRIRELNSETDQNLRNAILALVRQEKPQTVRTLLQLVQTKYQFPEEAILETIRNLTNQGILRFKEDIPDALMTFAFSTRAIWYGITLSLSGILAVLVLLIPNEYMILLSVRNFLGLVFTLFLPGYSIMKSLYPTTFSPREPALELQKEAGVGRIALSFLISLAAVTLTSLFLSISPWGITTKTITLALLLVTLLFSTIGVKREHVFRLKSSRPSNSAS